MEDPQFQDADRICTVLDHHGISDDHYVCISADHILDHREDGYDVTGKCSISLYHSSAVDQNIYDDDRAIQPGG